MTNQSTASKEPERDRDSERLRLHTPTTPSAAPSSSVKNEILELSSKQQRLDNDICSPSPPSRVPSSPGSSLSSIYQKKLLTTSASASATTTSITGSSSHHINSIIKEEPTFNDHRTHHQHRNDESMEDDDDDDENIQMKNEVGKIMEFIITPANVQLLIYLSTCYYSFIRSQYDSQFNITAKFNIIVC